MTSAIASSLHHTVQVLRTNPPDSGNPDRAHLLALARQVVTQLERPQDLIQRIGYETPSHQLCLRLAIDLGLFHKLTTQPTPISAGTLARTSVAEELLIIRTMRVLCAIHFAAEAGPHLYVPTAASHAMTDPAHESMVRSASDDTVQIFARLPRALRERGYRCPTDALDCPLQWTMGTRERYFDWVARNERQARDLAVSMKAMQIASVRMGAWFEYYPVGERLVDGLEREGGALLVDVGGGCGHDLKLLVERFSWLKEVKEGEEKLVLLELPEVVAAVDKRDMPGVRLISGSFFEPQPIQGARAYYTHRVLHNWADPQARRILQNVKEAMRPGYSRLLLNETILPSTGCSSFDAAGDMNMMGILGGLKRTTLQWMQLLVSVDLKVEKIWTSPEPENRDGIIEVIRAD